MSTFDEERRARLPKWAQEELAQLQRNADRWERQAEEARLATSPDDTDTTVERRMQGGAIGLKRGATVTFQLPAGEIQARVEGDHLLVMADWSGLVIQPRASNTANLFTGNPATMAPG
jgi:hypothetical protein